MRSSQFFHRILSMEGKYAVKLSITELPKITVNPVLLATATITVVYSQNEDENAKVGMRL